MEAIRVVAVAALCVVGLAACGSSASSSSTHASSADASAAAASCPTDPGLAAGEAYVGTFSTAKFWVASELASGFQSWLSGKSAAEPGAPAKPLCLKAQQAAAAVVLSWAAQHQAKIARSSAANYGGRNVVAYLKSQGVSCGSECGLKAGTQGAAVESGAAASVEQSNTAASANDATCSAADAAVSKFATDAGTALKNPSSASASSLDVDLGAAMSALTALKPQASASQQAELQDDIKSLTTLQSGGSSGNIDAQVIGLSLGQAPLKILPNLLGQICS
jgi:hypothetical protein